MAAVESEKDHRGSSDTHNDPDAIWAHYYVNNIYVPASRLGRQQQGPLGEYAFRLARGRAFTEAFPFNLTIFDKADYSRKKGQIILHIPLQYQKQGRVFSVIGLDRNGKPHIFGDGDNSPYSLLVDIDIEGYAFDLVYIDTK